MDIDTHRGVAGQIVFAAEHLVGKVRLAHLAAGALRIDQEIEHPRQAVRSAKAAARPHTPNLGLERRGFVSHLTPWGRSVTPCNPP